MSTYNDCLDILKNQYPILLKRVQEARAEQIGGFNIGSGIKTTIFLNPFDFKTTQGKRQYPICVNIPIYENLPLYEDSVIFSIDKFIKELNQLNPFMDYIEVDCGRMD